MNLQIGEKTLIKQVQHQFNEHYPFLKIEFFKKQYGINVLGKAERINSNEMVSVVGKLKGSVVIDTDNKRTVAELVNEFEKLLGLTIQVFRKSGNLWIETTLTEDWKLEQQNKEGEQISKPHSNEKNSNENRG